MKMTATPSLFFAALLALLLPAWAFYGPPPMGSQRRLLGTQGAPAADRSVNRLVRHILLYESNSKFNLNPSKLLEEARRIREEASNLQKESNDLADKSDNVVQDYTAKEPTALPASDFVSTTVLDKGLSSIQQLEKATPKEAKSDRPGIFQGSVLVDRASDSRSRQARLNKLDGSYNGAPTNMSLLAAYERVVGSAQSAALHRQKVVDMLAWDEATLGALYGGVGADAEFVLDEPSAQSAGSSSAAPADTRTLEQLYASLGPWWRRFLIKSLVKSTCDTVEKIILRDGVVNSVDKSLLELTIAREMIRVAEDFENLPEEEFNSLELEKLFNVGELEERVVQKYREISGRYYDEEMKSIELKAEEGFAGTTNLKKTVRRQAQFAGSSWRNSAQGEDMLVEGRRLDPDGLTAGLLRQTCQDLLTESEVLKATINEVQSLSLNEQSVSAEEVSVGICETIAMFYNKTVWWYDDLARSDILRQVLPDVEGEMRDTLRNLQTMLLFVQDPSIPMQSSEDVLRGGGQGRTIDSLFQAFGGLRGAFDGADGADGGGSFDTAAERLLVEYFDAGSRLSSMAISRVGAGRFQSDVLRDIFVVSSVTMSQGAVIFDGNPSTAYRDSERLAAALEQKYLASGNLSAEVRYTIIQNEKYPSLDGNMQQAALDSLLGSSPAVVVYPSSWNSTVSVAKATPFSRSWTNLLTVASVVISGAYAVGCYSLLDENTAFASDVPADLVSLAFLPILLNSVARVAEASMAKVKDVKLDAMLVPTTTMFTYGVRTTLLDMPKSRNDIFDIASVGIITLLVSSFVVFSMGLQMTAEAPASALETFPAVPLGLLKANAVVFQLVANALPNVPSTIGIVGAAAAAATSMSMVHMHWLAVAGALTFISATLQLLPFDNSAGSKLSYSVLGRENFYLFNVLIGLVKFAIIVPALFNIGGLPMVMNKYRLFTDYILSSQISSSAQDNQIAVDNLTPITDIRKIIFGGLCFVEFLSYFPYQEIGYKLQLLLADLSAFVSPPSSGLF